MSARIVLLLIVLLVVLSAPALCSPLQPSYASTVAWLVVEHSRVYDAFRPWEREVKFATAEALDWEVADYRETILLYYRLLYNAVLHNQMGKAARCLGTLLALLLKAKGYSDGESLVPVFETLDWSSVRILDLSEKEIVDYWLLYEPSSDEDFAYTYASVALSLLEKLPVNSFVRVLHAPVLREMYLLSFAAVLAASTYFVYRKSRLEGERVEVEAPP